ncbi:Pseudouridylate synthase, 23S RNA-specific [Candidatus Liberibacter americanus str. Sao Paulo]|uniref:Pseudouridine synthase n=2 Tax=Candidatus Liberibacter americanus TaxID=309868 RepID=U6B5Y2_9HYPH|nr:Pseudouridylate synthase, 23S RNA-specific [Candidatus Liberibacter americanus str. Sao Paulo]
MKIILDGCTNNNISLIADHASTERIDKWLNLKLKEKISRSYIKKLITNGYISVDDKIVSDPSQKIVLGNKIYIRIPKIKQLNIPQEYIPLDIIYEDNDIIVINKQAGLVVHPAPGNWSGTLVNALLYHCKNNLSGINGEERPGIVHRLDKDTTGIIIVAKNDIAHRELSEQFADHGLSLGLKRLYYAMVWGTPFPLSGTINAPLGRCRFNRLRQAVKKTNDKTACKAVTHYQTIESFNNNSNCAISLLKCQLETGRTHQIRVHMAYKGHPLVGDPLYGLGFKTKENLVNYDTKNAINKLARQALHAYHLSFYHPRNKERMIFEAPIPEDMAKIIKVI